ncbi:unnamed protein product [Cunninghamella blakesleeana]
MTAILEFCTPPVPGETHKYYGDAHNSLIKLPQFTPSPITPPVVTTKQKKSSEQKTLHDFAASGNLLLLKQILLLLPDPLKTVNDHQSTTGYTPLHYAAARGHLKIVECLIDDYAVSINARDKEGETALHKAAYYGHYHIVKYLVSKKANIHQKDKDGWTALHNACSKGYLPIARLLITSGARVDVRSKMGHTPLINAASKGYISIVEYLLDEAHANPLIKNNNGEAAYDISAASKEAYVGEILEKAERKWWHIQQVEGINGVHINKNATYNVLDNHVTVIVILHENQRANSLLGFSRPQFSASYLTKQDTRGPWSLHPSGKPTSKDQVEPPRVSDGTSNITWFWMYDWTLDYSDPRIDPTSGWQYARSFDEKDESWTPVAPTSGNGWVRRRRWVRVMNRQKEFIGIGNPHVFGAANGDYLSKAEDIISNITPQSSSYVNDNDHDQVRQHIQLLTKELRSYEEAQQTLLAGVKDDLNQYRKERANELIKSNSTRIEKLNKEITSFGTQFSTPISPAPLEQNEELARELGFTSRRMNDGVDDDRYPNKANGNDFDTNPWTRDTIGDRSSFQPLSLKRNHMNNATESNMANLLQHVDFNSNGDDDNEDNTGRQNKTRKFIWELDENVKDCRRCDKKFGLLNRRHHCRRCGLIVCDKCSTFRTFLSASEILQNPNAPMESAHVLESQHHRVCDKCRADLSTDH